MISRKIAALVTTSLIMSSSAAIAQSAHLSSLMHRRDHAGAELQDPNKLEGAIYITARRGRPLIWGLIELFDSIDNGPSSP